jgi:hypothetical protein
MKSASQIGLSLLVVFPLVATSCRKAAQDHFQVPLTFTDNGLPVVTATFTDTPVCFVVDTGSNRCLVDSATADALDLPPICPRSSSEVVIQGKTAEQVHVHDVSFTIESQVFIVRTLRIAELPGGRVNGIQGILGMDFLRAAHAVVDIEGERLVMRKPTSQRVQSNDNHAIHRTADPHR